MALDTAQKRFSFLWANYPDAMVDHRDALAWDWLPGGATSLPAPVPPQASSGQRAGARGKYIRPMPDFIRK